MNKNTKRPRNDDLYKAILKLQTLEECIAFMEDLCSVSELRAMEQRYEVAEMLYHGHIYSDILAKTGASSATISRVNRSLHYGSEGYPAILDRMAEEE